MKYGFLIMNVDSDWGKWAQAYMKSLMKMIPASVTNTQCRVFALNLPTTPTILTMHWHRTKPESLFQPFEIKFHPSQPSNYYAWASWIANPMLV